ncbi:MAG: type 4a pilus biogenesis protein PilO [Candidatus Yanofskybacteria bacterium]|nr:type 4a pilus biogenesis protein PilO [Candidatus Yanofskybacteria bacterium]
MNPNKNYIGAGLVALALVGAWGWVLPEYNKMSELNVALEERQGLYDSRSAIIKRIQDLNKEYQQKAADITRISSVLPSKKGLAEMVSAVDKLSAQSGLQLISAVIAGKPSDSRVGAYNSLPIEIALSGSYAGLVSFLQSAEKNLRIMDITSLDAAAGAADKPGLLNFSIKGNAYYLK